jgi:hypothetical protein
METLVGVEDFVEALAKSSSRLERAESTYNTRSLILC